MDGPKRAHMDVLVGVSRKGIPASWPSAKPYLPTRPCTTLVAFLARQGAHQLADNAQHDFVGTAADGDQPHVAVGP